MGIHTEGPYQAIYVDTPGLHIEEKRAINRLMNRAASSSLGDVELVILWLKVLIGLLMTRWWLISCAVAMPGIIGHQQSG